MVVSDCGQKRRRLLYFNDQAKNNRDQRQLATSCERLRAFPLERSWATAVLTPVVAWSASCMDGAARCRCRAARFGLTLRHKKLYGGVADGNCALGSGI